MKYFEKLWVITTARWYQKESRLSYMAQYVEKDGELAKETTNLQVTGRHWASQGEEAIIDNVWIQGFQVIALETRRRTSNRWFRVLDPRGYVFEISAENMLRIMLDGDVSGGLIKQPCRWEKEGSVFQLVVAE